jgi:AcrR family transcriptional regulator
MDTADLPAGLPAKELEPTRQRILEAARIEFAAFGLAGARVDRIARNASASKERLYAYYRKKEELFDAVLELNLTEFADAVSRHGTDLATFAGVLYDHTVTHPEHLRIIDWARLERQDGLESPNVIVDAFHAHQVGWLQRLQVSGHIDGGWDPEHLSVMIFGIISCWVHEPASAFSPRPASDTAVIVARRASVVRAVRRLVEPAAG